MNDTRPVGRLEKLSTTRHSLGLYHSVIVTCQYTVQQECLDVGDIGQILLQALARLVPKHAALCCSIVGESGETPTIRGCTSVDLKSHLGVLQLGHEGDILRQLEHNHDLSWDEIETRPGWKLLAFVRQAMPIFTSTVVDLAFMFHHALADGLSGVAFHRCLLQELRHVTREPRDTMNAQTAFVDVPEKILLTPPLEDLVWFPLSWPYLIQQILRKYAPPWLSPTSSPAWAGARPLPLSERPYSTRLRLISIPSPRLTALLSTIRAQNTTLTCFITGAIVVALATLLPDAERFVGATPYTMRQHTGTSFDAVVNQTSMFETAYEAGMLNELRALCPPDTTAKVKRVWKVAQYFQSQMKAALAQFPTDNPVGMLSYVSNYRQFYENKIGRSRAVTFEVSNLGVFTPSDADGKSEGADGAGWNIENMLFSQGAAVVGPALTISCASIRGGPLNLVITWQESVVDEDIVHGLVREFERAVDTVIA